MLQLEEKQRNMSTWSGGRHQVGRHQVGREVAVEAVLHLVDGWHVEAAPSLGSRSARRQPVAAIGAGAARFHGHGVLVAARSPQMQLCLVKRSERQYRCGLFHKPDARKRAGAHSAEHQVIRRNPALRHEAW
jgi:hypothetical protein